MPAGLSWNKMVCLLCPVSVRCFRQVGFPWLQTTGAGIHPCLFRLDLHGLRGLTLSTGPVYWCTAGHCVALCCSHGNRTRVSKWHHGRVDAWSLYHTCVSVDGVPSALSSPLVLEPYLKHIMDRIIRMWELPNYSN